MTSGQAFVVLLGIFTVLILGACGIDACNNHQDRVEKCAAWCGDHVSRHIDGQCYCREGINWVQKLK